MNSSPIEIRPAAHAPVPGIVSEFDRQDPFLAERVRIADVSLAELQATAEKLERTRFDRGELVARLRELNRLCENPSATEAIEALADPRTLVVATGQQPGFCGGPLYTAYKAATAIAEARRLSTWLDRRVVPVFWIASDDHDLAEIGGLTLLSPELDLRKHRVRFAEELIPSARVTLDESMLAIFEAVRSDPAADLASVAFPAPRIGERWPIWFGRILSFLFPGSGLVLFEPAECRSLVEPFLTREMEHPSRSVAALREGMVALTERGYEPPLSTDASSLLFHVENSRRQRWNPNAATKVVPIADVSPDAALRCVMQSAILPTLLVLGGPGELRYWMQLRELFAAHGVERPLFGLRFSATLVTPPIRRAAEAVSLVDSEWFIPERDLEARVKASNQVDTSPWADAAERVRSQFKAFAAPLAQLGGSLPNKVSQAESALSASLHKLIESGAQRVRETAGVSEKKIRQLSRSVFPSGLPQERVFPTLPYLARYGSDLFERIAGSLPDRRAPHSFVELGGAAPP